MVFIPYTINTTQSRIATAQALRTSLVVLNNSANIVYVGAKGQDAQGWPIGPGGTVSFKVPEDNPTEELWAISSGAATNIRVYEGYGGIRP